jgi:enoyl-CoA hydratase/carnithine racemase
MANSGLRLLQMTKPLRLRVLFTIEVSSGETSVHWGYVNRALPDDELRTFVERLATRIASFPPGAVARAKAAVDAALPDPLEGLLTEDDLFRSCLTDPEAQARLTAFLEHGGQTGEIERHDFPPDWR